MKMAKKMKKSLMEDKTMDKFYTIRKYSKIFTEGRKQYFFDVPKYMKILLDKGYSAEAITAKIELIIEDEQKLKSSRTIARVREFSEGSYHSVNIETIKLVGVALAGDEYAFLEEVNLTYLAKVMEEAETKETDELKVIYRMMQKIILEYEISCAYNYRPGTQMEDGFEYYDLELENIRSEIYVRFMSNEDYRNRLCKILGELEEFVKSYSIPGTNSRWLEISPELKYFDCVYQFIEETPDIFDKIENSVIHFSFIPTQKEIKERNEYFAKIIKESYQKNLKYSEERIFQNQLVESLEQIFIHDFPEIRNIAKGKEK